MCSRRTGTGCGGGVASDTAGRLGIPSFHRFVGHRQGHVAAYLDQEDPQPDAAERDESDDGDLGDRRNEAHQWAMAQVRIPFPCRATESSLMRRKKSATSFQRILTWSKESLR